MSDFKPFLDWYSQRYLRSKGRSPSVSGLRSKDSHCLTACRTLSLNCTAKDLAFALADRDTTDDLLDRLLVVKSPVYVRCMAFTLLAFAEYAKLTFGTGCTLKLRDVPNPQYVPRVDVYEDGDVERLLTGALVLGLRHHLFLLTLVETGRRLNEVLGIRYEDLRLDLAVPYLNLVTTKGGVPQAIPLSPRLVAALSPENLAKLKAESTRATKRSKDEFLFCWTDHAARETFIRLCTRLGVPYKRVHGTRHTWATNKLAAGVPLHAVSKLLGHKSTAITERVYDHSTAMDFYRYL